MSSEADRPYGESVLAPFASLPLPGGAFPTPVVLVKGDERLGDVIAAYAAEARADLAVCGSHHLCVTGGRGGGRGRRWRAAASELWAGGETAAPLARTLVEGRRGLSGRGG